MKSIELERRERNQQWRSGRFGLLHVAWRSVVLLLVVPASLLERRNGVVVAAFAPLLQHPKQQQQPSLHRRTCGEDGTTVCRPTMRLWGEAYKRGAEIWPETNMDQPISLEDSFPGGVLPPDVKKALSLEPLELATEAVRSSVRQVAVMARLPGRKRRMMRSVIQNILRGAASSESERRNENDDQPQKRVDKTLLVTAVALVGLRLTRPTDLLFCAFFSGYLLVLDAVARSPSSTELLSDAAGQSSGVLESTGCVMPSLPPQGHVPALVSNPLGRVFTDSSSYLLWLRVGSAVGLTAPLLAVTWYCMGGISWSTGSSWARGVPNMVAATACARPLFLLCFQVISETISRRALTPLPIRILIPVAYNAFRLGPIWEWALAPNPLGTLGRLLAVANLLYWTVNLFGFLLPTATIRYMRAHFFCVEATEVVTRPGGEASVGLLS
uniref:DUF7733 domain-containing protein n=1 Tax=Attheya septentrionalis TaxID=420275 RepID=A0A7S2UIT9_9STRA|mmetsp:Transcript_2723/g.4944  ORF Transcript_2723/g.4944 Transcript_2723/m.4944 type:complete len:441 (+) Transcript_2723:182-1504(+)